MSIISQLEKKKNNNNTKTHKDLKTSTGVSNATT